MPAVFQDVKASDGAAPASLPSGNWVQPNLPMAGDQGPRGPPGSNQLPAAIPELSADTKQTPRDEVRGREGLVIEPSTRRLSYGEVSDKKLPPDIKLWMVKENDQAWVWFRELDDDASGFLDPNEVKALCSKLNVKIRDFKAMWAELDEDNSGTVAFPEFVRWFNDRKAKERREQRLAVRDLFEKTDKDRSGGIGKDELRTFYRKAKRRLNLVDPPFDLDKDFAMMSTGTGNSDIPEFDEQVTFHMFENWWKERTGIVDVTIPVLPEFMVYQIAEVGALYDRRNKVDIASQKGRRGKELWDYLKPRLRLIVNMQTEWGGVNNLYPSRGDSIFQVVPLPPGIRDPDSTFSAWWDLSGIVLLLYVAITVPMRTCFELEVEVVSGEWFVDLVIDIYFAAVRINCLQVYRYIYIYKDYYLDNLDLAVVDTPATL
jgi:Ca2+-binding EF-hand superfamily protein